MTCDKPTVYIIDDDLSVRSALEALAWAADWKAASFASAGEFLASARATGPACLVLDVSLPDISGLELQTHLASEHIGMPIVFISGYGDVPMTVQAMKAGAEDFFTKPFRGEDLLGAIERAMQRSRAALQHDAEMAVLRTRYTSLSCRERQVMNLVVDGLLNKQVADRLAISEITVKTHRGHAMRKMKASSLADMVRMSTRLGERSALDA
jgi:FixJ family two-component response regulator